MSEGEALLRGVLLRPDDDTARLVYADWLQENGDEKRAEFIRDTRANWFHVNNLWGELGASIPTAKIAGYGRNDGTGLPYWTFNLPRLWGMVIYARGFVSEIHLPLAAFMEHAKALFSAHPIERVSLVDWHRFLRGTAAPELWWANAGAYPGIQDALPDVICPAEEYSGAQKALDALSDQCIDYGRELAGLPAALPVPLAPAM